MHALVVNVTINDLESATEMLNSQVVPQVSQAPGFVAGYWTRSDNRGLSMVVFESEDAAQAAAQRLQSEGTGSDAVTLDSAELREVVASA
jgi:pseudouridine-5'-phosphate glycosidase